MISLIELAGHALLFLLVFGMSATVDFPSIKHQLRNTRAILCGLFLQFVFLPFVGFAVVNILDMDKATGITLLVLTSSPGGSYSNWWCSMFNADLALSVTMTAISTIASTVFLPINLLIYVQWSYHADVIGSLDWTSLFVAIAIVVAAILLGLYCSAKIYSRRFNVLANKIGNVAGVALIMLSFAVTNTGSSDTKIWSRDWKFYLGVALPCVVAIIVANVLTSFLKLLKPERVTVSVETCYQNVGIATSVGESCIHIGIWIRAG
jgi:predicted Na+-dependent transporter